jgi:hypothetical protein
MFNRKSVKYTQYTMKGGKDLLEIDEYKKNVWIIKKTRNLSKNESMPVYYMWKCVEKRNQNVKEDSKKLTTKWSIAHGKTTDIVGKYSQNCISRYLSHMSHKQSTLEQRGANIHIRIQ